MSKPALLEGEALGKRGASTFSDRFASVANTCACYSVHGAGQTNALHFTQAIRSFQCFCPPLHGFALFLAVSKVKFGHHVCRRISHPLGLNPAGVLLFRMRTQRCFRGHEVNPFLPIPPCPARLAVWAPCLQTIIGHPLG